MNTPDKPNVDPAEWDAQEKGMRAAKGRDAADVDALAESYRLVARSLASGPRSEPPADFAASVVAHVAKHEAGVERLVSRALFAAFAAGAIVMGVLYGDECWAALKDLPGIDASGWVLLGTTCVILSWIPRQLLALTGLRHALHRG